MIRAYKIRSYRNGVSKKKGIEYTNYCLTVPFEIAEALPDGMNFVPRMTEEGLLYEPVAHAQPRLELPEWAKAESKNNQQAA